MILSNEYNDGITVFISSGVRSTTCEILPKQFYDRMTDSYILLRKIKSSER